jgi:hypothetical protein
MKNDRIWYKELLSLGFDKKSSKDEVFFELYGYEYFYMTLMLNKDILAEWSPTSGNVTLYRTGKNEKLFTTELTNYDELYKLVAFFGKLPTKS